MKKRKLLLWFQVKMAFCFLPKMLLSAVIFGILLSAAGLFLMQYHVNETDEKNTIAVVLPENSDRYTRMAFQFLENVDTIKDICNFVQMDEEVALKGVEDGTVAAVILVPDEFIKHILNGTNVPAEIIIPENSINSQSTLIHELIEAGAGDLGAAQAGIYAISDVCGYFRLQKVIPDAEEYLNKEYFSYVLDRNSHFDVEEVSAYGGMTSIQFYISSGMIAFFLFCGIFCVELFKRDKISFYYILKRENVSQIEYSVFKVFGTSLVYFIISMVSWIMLRLACIRFERLSQYVPELTLVSVMGLFVMLYSLFSVIFFIYQIMNHQAAGILLLLLVITVSLFISGAIVPSALLPKGVQALSGVSPITQHLQLCRQILTDSVSSAAILTNIIWAAVFICLPTLQSKLKLHRGSV